MRSTSVNRCLHLLPSCVLHLIGPLIKDATWRSCDRQFPPVLVSRSERAWRKSALVLSTLFLFSARSYAQIEPASRLLNSCQQAMGVPGEAFTLTGSGTISVPDSRISAIQLTFRSSGSARAIWTESIGEKTLIRHWNGPRSQVIGTDGKKHPSGVSANLYYLPELIPAYACHPRKDAPVTSLQFVGTENRYGFLVDHLHIRRDDKGISKTAEAVREQIQSFDVFLDAQTHIVVGISRYVSSDEAIENRARVEWHYSQYQTVSGVLVPTLIERQLNGHAYDTIQISDVSAGNLLTEADFQ